MKRLKRHIAELKLQVSDTIDAKPLQAAAVIAAVGAVVGLIIGATLA